MKHTARTIIALAIVLLGNSQVGADPIVPGPTPVEIPQVSDLTVGGASAEQRARVDEVLIRFEEVGLELPALLIEFHDNEEACGGNAGYYWSPRPEHPGVHRIAICSAISSILIHELGHAWDRHNTTEEMRRVFADHWGLEGWNDHGDDWYHRAGERAADTIAYALGWDSPTDNVNILRFVCGFEVLTGLPIPEIHQQSCATTPEARYLAESGVRPPLSS